MPMRYAEVSQKELKFLDLTSLTVEEFQQLLPVFEKEFRERLKHFCLDGKPRVGRGYRTYSNCPLPTPEDRLLFILVYLKNNPLQVMQGELFGMPQNKANQWIHTLLPVLLITMRSLGDAPVFPGGSGAKSAWEGARETESQRISWTQPMVEPEQQRSSEPFVGAFEPSIVL